MADVENAALSVAAETEKTTTAVEQACPVANGAETERGPVERAEDTVATESGPKDTIETTIGAQESPSGDKKRKFEERDWRERRDEDRSREGGDRDNHRGGRGGRGRGRGRGGPRGEYRNYNDNVRTAYDNQPESSDPDEIRKQVEFYFSDSNLLTDRFLLTKIGGSTNDPVPVKVIHSFKRMRHFQPYSAVVAALRESETLNIIGDDGSEEIQRKIALPAGTTENPDDNVEIFEDKTRTRSIYAKGFGEEGPNTQFDIEAFFAPYGPTNAIRLRRSHPDKLFKGSVFVEFDSDETAKAFLELENKPKWEGKDLRIQSKEEYVRTKAEDVKHGRIDSNSGRGARGRGRGNLRAQRGSRGGRGRGGRGGRDRDDERRKRSDRSRSRSRSDSRSRSPYRRGDSGSNSERETKNDPAPTVKSERTEAAPTAQPEKDAGVPGTSTISGDSSSKKRGRGEDHGDVDNDKSDLKKVRTMDAKEA